MAGTFGIIEGGDSLSILDQYNSHNFILSFMYWFFLHIYYSIKAKICKPTK
jgi:hypothetical protein